MPRPTGFVCTEYSDYFLSTSVFNALRMMEFKINTHSDFSEICKIINPYEYVFSNDTCVSKLTTSNLYYELCEIFNTFSTFKTFHEGQILHVGEELVPSPFHLLFNSANIFHCSVNNIASEIHPKIIFIDIGVNLILALDIIFRLLPNEGSTIIKLQTIYKKQTISILYLLSIVFDKTFIVKPSIINILSNEMFILCIGRNKQIVYEKVDVMAIDIPAVFLCKIEEFNSVNGHRQLDAYEQIFNLHHNPHRTIKLELLKKTNIQKSIEWCVKHNIPHNKGGGSDKINMFL
jgi:hypothetical protein